MSGMPRWMLAAILVCAACKAPPAPTQANAYADPALCASCHAEIYRAYRQSGMARSFSAFRFDRTAASFTRNRFHHPKSDRHYEMIRRGERAYMRRFQLDAAGLETNVLEKSIDFIMGSGHKAQTFLHRNQRGELIQLPVAWYTADGGYWAMNPGYDRPDHEDFRRRIRHDCFFCHNSYPAVADDSFYGDAVYPPQLPEGIDCQRCHGPGGLHAKSGAPEQIINPARLPPARAMEVCLQCHLQSTSRALPYSVLHLDRGVFSYRAGEPLAEYANHFDEQTAGGKFEIAHAAYRLRQSRCFLASDKLGCTTCHDPHHVERGPQRASKACRTCHAAKADAAHRAATECVSCHMPRRRTDDVVHVVMTDHRIQRRPPANLLAAKEESPDRAYRGRVTAYYPQPADPLLEAVAQVRAGANLEQGIPLLEQLLLTAKPTGPQAYYELAEAYWKAGNSSRAFHWHEQSLARDPGFLPALRSFGMELSESGQLERGSVMLRRALDVAPKDPRTLHDLGVNFAKQGKHPDAVRTLRAALAADPDAPETQNALAASLFELGDAAGAEAAFRSALRARPDYTLARDNLARLLALQGRR